MEEDGPNKTFCDWCSAAGYIIQEKTPLEEMCDEIREMGVEKFMERFDEWKDNMIKEVTDAD
jgi:hypothetical protein